MKKTGASLIVILLIFSLVTLVLAQDTNETDDNSNQDNSNSDKIDKAFDCLETKAGDCSTLSNQEIALTILAGSDNVYDDCVNELLSRKSSDNWGNVRDTALAILALNHAGEDTEPSEKWLLTKTLTPTDLIWYLEQDSNEATECHIAYDGNDYTVSIGEDKKISKDAGSCLTRAQSNFWFKISTVCYGEKFIVECDKDFITTLLYKNLNSPTIYVLEGTQGGSINKPTETTVTSKCFGESSCNYEATAWATLALLKNGYNVEDYIPYLIALSDTNKKYLPDSFVYMVTNYEDYATRLMEQRKLGNYWQADNSAYDKYYDTALAILSIGNFNSEQIDASKDWLLFSQDSSGCWSGSVRDTAMVLWALVGKVGHISGGGGSETTCSEANFFCIPNSECSTADKRENYYCASLSTVCCASQNLKTCSDYPGVTCESTETCIGNTREATDTSYCCTGYCEEKTAQGNECEENFYSCKDSCSDTQEEIDYGCDGNQICCRTKTSTTTASSSWWIWLLVILILIVLGVIAWIKREELKLFWFKLKSKFKKDKGGPKGTGQGFPPRPGYPPRPGFPPVRRAPTPMPPRRQSQRPQDKDLDNTFEKLKRMSS
ncbi:MAG: hypothetical protein ABIF88_01225 [archaeon]